MYNVHVTHIFIITNYYLEWWCCSTSGSRNVRISSWINFVHIFLNRIATPSTSRNGGQGRLWVWRHGQPFRPRYNDDDNDVDDDYNSDDDDDNASDDDDDNSKMMMMTMMRMHDSTLVVMTMMMIVMMMMIIVMMKKMMMVMMIMMFTALMNDEEWRWYM